MISIHALREEGDYWLEWQEAPRKYFYPRPPRGGRHSSLCYSACCPPYFYPRPPRGGRHCTACLKVVRKKFLSTPSARRATRRRPPDTLWEKDFYPRPPRGGRQGGRRSRRSPHRISIHALREEGDLTAIVISADNFYFYPRPPRGGRPVSLICPVMLKRFLSTPSARRATRCAAASARWS